MGVKGFKIYFIIISIIFLCPLAYCSEFNMNSQTSATLNGSMNKYHGYENYEYGSSNNYNFGTRYNGRLGEIETFFHYPFEANTTYRLTYNMATNDFRNNLGSSYWWDCDHNSSMTNLNTTVVMPVYVSMKKVQFTFTPTQTCDCISVSLRSTSPYGSISLTGVSNWQLNNITIYDPDWQSGSGSGQGTATPSPSSTPDSSEQIINNQNQNTSDIITNNNENTQNIIDNQNQNQQQTNQGLDNINNQLGSCYKNMFDLRHPLSLSTATYSFSGNNLTYTGSWKNVQWDMPITSSGYYTYSSDTTLPSNVNIQLYYVLPNGERSDWLGNINSGSSSGSIYTSYTNGYIRLILYDSSNSSITFTLNNIRFTNTNGVKPFSNYNQNICSSKLDDVSGSITNDNVDSGTGTSFFNDFTTSDNGGISAIVTKPLTIINNLLTNNNQCANLVLPEFLGVSNAYLPSGCILWNNASETMVSIWNIFVCGFASYYILKDLFKIVENLKNPDNDKVEVIDL